MPNVGQEAATVQVADKQLTVDTVQADAVAPLQAIVDQAEAASADLRAQLATKVAARDALAAQMAPISADITTLKNQITAAEGDGAQRARDAIALVGDVLAGRTGLRGRFFRGV
jgi:uncharacterized protein involved in exopolysaccharide biosynthesis